MDERVPDKVRVDWLPYERTTFRTRADEVTATLRGFAAGEVVTLRVVSVDATGQLSQPSPLITATTSTDRGWWRPTPLKGLLLLLAGCLALLIRKRVQDRRLLRQLDAERMAEDPPVFTSH